MLVVGAAACLCVVWFVVFRLAGGGGSLNVLLITLDTTRADHLGCYGRARSKTPNIDRLARDGTVFRRCSSCTSLTLPSHTSILTGVYPYAHGVRRNTTNRVVEGAVVIAEVLKDAGFATQAVVASVVLNRMFGLAQGFDVYRDVAAPADAFDAMRAERRGDQVCDDAIELLRSVAADRFFLWVHFYDPHFPYVARRPGRSSPAQAYEDEIEFTDVQIGRLMRELKRLRLEDETLVVLVGDHGEGLDQHDEWQHGYFVYETTLHVPLIFWGRGVPAGHAVHYQVRTIDVAPTILDLLGEPALGAAQGVSLRPLMSDGAGDPALAAYAESLEAHVQLGLSRLRSLTFGGWKYTHGPEPELYDLSADPGETDNRIIDQPERAAELRERLRSLLFEAPAPPRDSTGGVELSATDLARLRSLGYAGSTPIEDEADLSELETFEPDGENPAAHTKTIRLYEESRQAAGDGRFTDAEQLLKKVVEVLPRAALPLGDLAHALHRLGRLDDASRCYEKALALKPTSFHLHIMCGQLLLDANRFEDAAAHFTAALAQMEDSVIALQNLGMALTSLGRYDEARQQFQRALEIQPRNVRVMHSMGVFYLRQNNLAEAANMFRKALDIDPTQQRLRNDLQRVLQAMERQSSG